MFAASEFRLQTDGACVDAPLFVHDIRWPPDVRGTTLEKCYDYAPVDAPEIMLARLRPPLCLAREDLFGGGRDRRGLRQVRGDSGGPCACGMRVYAYMYVYVCTCIYIYI